MNKLTEEQISLLNTPLPPWAVKPHPSKSYLSTIDPMAVVDRLNEVFGIGGWNAEYEVVSENENPVVKCTLTAEDIKIQQFGGNDNKDLGDAYKGAGTDALTKCASYLGIGASIYKGQGNNQKMEDKKFTDMMDNFIREHKMVGDPGQLEEMNSTQRYIYDFVRKSINRTKQEK